MNFIYGQGINMSISKEQALEDGIKLLAANDYKLGEFNPHGVSAWLVSDLYAGQGIAIGAYESEALDMLCDETKYFDCLQAHDGDDTEEFTPLGNASELFDLTYTSIQLIVRA